MIATIPACSQAEYAGSIPVIRSLDKGPAQTVSTPELGLRRFLIHIARALGLLGDLRIPVLFDEFRQPLGDPPRRPRPWLAGRSARRACRRDPSGHQVPCADSGLRRPRVPGVPEVVKVDAGQGELAHQLGPLHPLTPRTPVQHPPLHPGEQQRVGTGIDELGQVVDESFRIAAGTATVRTPTRDLGGPMTSPLPRTSEWASAIRTVLASGTMS
jgi:hypothetical protein